MNRLLLTLALPTLCCYPSTAQPPAAVKELERLDKLIADEMDKLKPSVEARYDIIDWRDQKEGAAKIPVAKGGKGTLVLADDLTLNKAMFSSFDRSCPKHFTILADTLRVKDFSVVSLNALNPADTGGTCVFTVRRLVWADGAAVAFTALSNQQAGNLVLEAAEAEADSGGKKITKWAEVEKLLENHLTTVTLGSGTAKIQQSSWGAASANLVAQAKACESPLAPRRPGGPAAPAVTGKADEVGEWQALYELRLTNARLKRLLAPSEPEIERNQTILAYYLAIRDKDDKLRKELYKGLESVTLGVVKLLKTETVQVQSGRRQATVVRDVARNGEYWIMPTDVLFTKDTRIGGKSYLGFGVIESEEPHPLTLVAGAKLTLDPLVEFEVKQKLKDDKCNGLFRDWRVKSKKNDGLALTAGAQADGVSLLVELTVTQDKPAESLSFQKMLKPEGLPVDFAWQSLKYPTAQGEITLGLSFARRTDAIRHSGDPPPPVNGEKMVGYQVNRDHDYNASIRYAIDGGRFNEFKTPLALKARSTVPAEEKRKLFIPPEAVDFQIDDPASVINEFRLKVAGDLVSRVKVRNLAEGEIKGFGKLSYVEVSMKVTYSTSDGRAAELDVPKFVLAAHPAEGSEHRRPYILPDGAKGVRFVGEAVAVCSDGRRKLPFDTGDPIISITKETLEAGRMK